MLDEIESKAANTEKKSPSSVLPKDELKRDHSDTLRIKAALFGIQSPHLSQELIPSQFDFSQIDPITADITSLSKVIPAHVLQAYESNGITKMYPWQVDCLNSNVVDSIWQCIGSRTNS